MKNLKKNLCSLITLICILLNAIQLHAEENTKIIYKPIENNELNVLLKSKTLRVAMYKGDTPPFYYQPELEDGTKGKLQGIDVEIIEGFARKLGLAPVYLRTDTLDGAIDLVANGGADVAICKLSITFSRVSKVLFTKPYIKLRKGLLVNRVKLEALQKQLGNVSKTEAIQQLSGKLGVIEDSSYVTFAQQRFQNDKLEHIRLSSWDDIVDNVSEGKYIAAFRDEAEIKRVIADDKSKAIPMLTVDFVGDYDLKGIALPLNSHHLKSLLDLHIDSLGLELTASSLLFDYPSVIKQLNRYKNSE